MVFQKFQFQFIQLKRIKFVELLIQFFFVSFFFVHFIQIYKCYSGGFLDFGVLAIQREKKFIFSLSI